MERVFRDRDHQEAILPFELAKRVFKAGIIVKNAEYFYKINTPTGEHEPEFTRKVILRAWGTDEVPWDVFIPAPTVREFEAWVDVEGLFVDDDLLEEINEL